MKRNTFVSTLFLVIYFILDCTIPLFGDDTTKLILMYIICPILCIWYLVKNKRAHLIVLSIYELIFSIFNVLFGLSIFAKSLLYIAKTELWNYLNSYFISLDIIGLPIWLQPVLFIFITIIIFLFVKWQQSKNYKTI